MKTAKLSDYYTAEDANDLAFIWTPLFKAMADHVKELLVTPDEFVQAMRSAVAANVYVHVFTAEGSDYPSILAMKITLI